jgi:DNA-binding XRE family transcriptional regulator
MDIKSRANMQPKDDVLDPLIQDIVRTRKSQRLTQQQVADLAGVSRRTIVLIESGGDCTLSTLRRICTALGLQINAHTQHLPDLDDITRENELLFFKQRSSQNN